MLAYLGVNVPVIYTGVFILGSALAGIGDALSAPSTAPPPGMDAIITVDCFVIVIVGGLGSIVGSFVGVAGAIFGMFHRGMYIESAFWTESATVLIMALLGGIYSFFGPAIGAATLISSPATFARIGGGSRTRGSRSCSRSRTSRSCSR